MKNVFKKIDGVKTGIFAAGVLLVQQVSRY